MGHSFLWLMEQGSVPFFSRASSDPGSRPAGGGKKGPPAYRLRPWDDAVVCGLSGYSIRPCAAKAAKVKGEPAKKRGFGIRRGGKGKRHDGCALSTADEKKLYTTG
jgi:hypothetical protein